MIRLGTFNIRLGIQEGVESIASVLKRYDLDIIALQEVGEHWTMGPEGSTTDKLAVVLGMYGAFVPAIVEGVSQYGTALLTRFEIDDFDSIELPEELDEPRRMARFRLNSDEKLTVFTTHLSHIDDRAAQWPVLHRHVFGADGPAFLLGDLNERADAAEIQKLKAEWVDCDPADRDTFPSKNPDRRLDYIFASSGTFSETLIDSNDTASDHRLVTTSWVP